jgi:2-polyprenyl-3-methyl-5-hydroxy-6-metoxy-1,4-benzoquinol methylase
VITGYIRWHASEPHKAAGTVLDIGCGTGLLRSRLEGVPFAEYVGVDLSEAAIEEARARDYARSRFVVGDATTSDLGRFDVIVLNEVLYYVDDGAEFVRRVAAMVRADGLVLVSMWRHPGDHRLWKTVGSMLQVVDQVEIRNRTNGRAWIVACCRGR